MTSCLTTTVGEALAVVQESYYGKFLIGLSWPIKDPEFEGGRTGS